MSQIIDLSTGAFYCTPDFSINSRTRMEDIIACFGAERLSVTDYHNGYSNVHIYNLKNGACYFSIIVYFEREQVTHCSFWVGPELPEGGYPDDPADELRSRDFMTAWMGAQAGDTRTFTWNLDIAGRNYHFAYDWGGMGVYYDFKNGSFNCSLSYKR